MDRSWREGCPVSLDDLRLLTIPMLGAGGRVADGELVVHVDHAEDLLDVFAELLELEFPIERMRLVDEFGADDDNSMAANNTSAFNCRRVANSSSWSEHAFGGAVDINPLVNPYVSSSGRVSPPEGAQWADRNQPIPGGITPEVIAAFERIGWQWGGNWNSAKDYQHFSASGR